MYDILIPYHASNNEELRYALRSIELYQPGRVLLVGDKPDWFKGDHIPYANTLFTKQMNVKDKILAATPYISEDFILWNDDIYKLSPDPLTPSHRGTLKEALKEDLTAHFHAALQNTAKVYPEGLYYGNHYPIIINGEKFKQATDLDWRKDYNVKSLYGNYAGITGEYREDCKIKSKDDIRRFISGRQFLSTPTYVTKEMMKILSELFQNKSKYEV